MTEQPDTDISGPFRCPRNTSREAGEGSIHDVRRGGRAVRRCVRPAAGRSALGRGRRIDRADRPDHRGQLSAAPRLLRDHLTISHFVFGSRPSTADFGLHGQLTQLVQVEPPSMALARDIAPRAMAWVDVMDDLSGFDVPPTDDDTGDGWAARDELGPTFAALLHEIGRTYAPFMVANAEAYDARAKQVRCTIEGREYWQKPFAYQRKCLPWIREEREALDDGDRRFVDSVLDGTGCEVLFA